MPLSRIDLADIGNPQLIADEIVRRCENVAAPIPVEELALQLDILDIAPLDTDGFEGGLLTDIEKSSGIILVNQNSQRQRQRFTIGHELGHFLCPTHRPTSKDGFLCSLDDMKRTIATASERAKRIEVEANSFSAALLMPASLFVRDLRKLNGINLNHITDLARTYDTSKEATTRRYVELHDEPAAAIVSQDLTVKRIYRSKDFPYIELRPGQRIPESTLTAQFDGEIGLPSDWRATDASLWVSSQSGARFPSMDEQVLRQRNGYRLTLLAIEAAEEDESDEDGSLVESWTPRFRR